VNTGPDGDPNPEMILADIVSTRTGLSATAPERVALPAPPAFSLVDVQQVERQPPVFTVDFTEANKVFYINGQVFAADAPPMVKAKVGTLAHWRIVNSTHELHPLHIHQAHFLTFLENDRPIPDPHWLDTVNVPVGGSVDVIMDFTNPVIRGMSVFHCHLLNHEDKGMMAKILFE
jgi:FtsP/CotA-like multicopper oxidase with cupredoxin domain